MPSVNHLSAGAGAESLDDLVQAARRGELAALDALIRALADNVYGLAIRMTANVADAEDATQEILIKIVTGLDSFRGDASVRTWAYRIAARHIIDRKRSRVEAQALHFESFADDLLDGLAASSTPEDAGLVEEVKLGCTLAMLTCLDREHRLAFVLCDVLDLQNDLAADVAGVSGEVHRQRL